MAQAASTALPPRSKMRAPAVAASGLPGDREPLAGMEHRLLRARRAGAGGDQRATSAKAPREGRWRWKDGSAHGDPLAPGRCRRA